MFMGTYFGTPRSVTGILAITSTGSLMILTSKPAIKDLPACIVLRVSEMHDHGTAP